MAHFALFIERKRLPTVVTPAAEEPGPHVRMIQRTLYVGTPRLHQENRIVAGSAIGVRTLVIEVVEAYRFFVAGIGEPEYAVIQNKREFFYILRV